MAMVFSLCESVAASGRSPWHIRALEKGQEKRVGGGIDTNSLCERVKAPYGWDLNVSFHAHVDQEHVCRVCRELYADYLRTGSIPFKHLEKKYVRMRDIDGLEKQVLDQTARIEWYVLHQPAPERPFYLLEFEMSRRLHPKSERWFKPELLWICVPKEKVSGAFLRALASPPPGVRSSTGTSSGRREKPSVRKTTSASRR